jgi:hypothetical protein
MKIRPDAARLRAFVQVAAIRVSATAASIAVGVTVPLIRIRATTGRFVKALNVADNPVIQSIMVFVLGRGLADSFAVTDTPDVVPQKRPVDAASITDVREPFLIGKGLFENPKVEEGDYFAEDYTDPGYTIVSFEWTLEKPFSEIPSIGDALSPFQIGKVSTDGVDITDQVVLSRILSIIDAPEVADSGTLRMQDYCEFDYFAEDYVGESRTF